MRRARFAPKYFALISIAPVLLGVDQFTKHWVVTSLSLSESHPLISGFFNLTYVRNAGAAFGILHDASDRFRTPFFVIVPIAALITMGYVFRRIASTDYKLASALALVASGAVGNLLDRLQLGYVIDFLDFHWKYRYHFPAFNVADMAICAGVAALLFDLLFRPERQGASPQANEAKHASHPF